MPQQQLRRVLVFSKTAGFRHESVEAGVAAIVDLGRTHGFDVDATEDADWFTDERLAAYDVVVWMQVSGVVLEPSHREAYERFTSRGGGFVGVHAASDGERGWPLYDALVGARFASHPPGVSDAVLHRADVDDPSIEGRPASWSWTDEWYRMDRDPSVGAEVLVTVDPRVFGENTTEEEMGTTMPGYPVTWRRTAGPARAWYTSLGHEPEAYADEDFRSHLHGGLLSAAGVNA